MNLPTTDRPRVRSFTASAAKRDKKDTPTSRRLGQEWQKRALLYTKLVPELNYASRFYSRMLSRVMLFPATRGADDKLTPITEGRPLELLDRIQDPAGGRSGIQSRYGRLMMITGEGYLFGRDLGGDDEKWSFVWIDEIDMDDKGRITWKPTGDTNAEGKTYAASKAVAYRMWTPSPEASNHAESPMSSVLEVAEELVVLTKGVRATAVSRMVNGMLKVPSELSLGAAEGGSDEDPELNVFMDDLIAFISGAVENAGSAEAAAPFIVEAAYEYLDKLEWMSTHDPQNDYMERELRKEAVQRLAWGLDFPPEVLTGLAESNHWTGRQITHDMWKSHGAPVAEQMCDDFGEAYLRPALREENYPDWQDVVVGYDDANVVTSPDRSEDADRAYDRGQLSDDGYLKLKGIPEDMAPSTEEKAIWLAVKMRDATMLPEGFRPAPERGPDPDPEDRRDAEEGPAVPTNGRDGTREESRAAVERVLGAAELALARCREVAGARVRSQKDKNPSLFQNVNGQPNTVVAALIGPEGLAALDLEPLKLVTSGTDAFKMILLSWGYSVAQSEAIAEMLTVYAARTLFETLPSLPHGFEAHIERTLEASHGV